MNASQKRKLKSLFYAMDQLTDHLGETMPLRQALAFVAVAVREADEGFAEVRDVANDVGAPSGVASRDLLGLGKRGRTGKPGLDLIVVREDYSDLRRRPYVLTRGGKAAIEAALEAL